MLTRARILELLEPFGISLQPKQAELLRAYLQLLLRWNEKISLTSIRNEEECVTRHFGESLLLSQYENLTEESRLLDIGSGAGFPGLALKLVFPAMGTTLLEPTGKKRAFLKEVVRTCRMEGVTVRAERVEQMAGGGERYTTVTARAVGNLPGIMEAARELLEEGGRLHLWLSGRQAQGLSRFGFERVRSVRVPLGRDLEILTMARVRERGFT